jgi:hypothetical protein
VGQDKKNLKMILSTEYKPGRSGKNEGLAMERQYKKVCYGSGTLR